MGQFSLCKWFVAGSLQLCARGVGAVLSLQAQDMLGSSAWNFSPVAACTEDGTSASWLFVGVLELNIDTRCLTLFLDDVTKLVLADATKVCCHLGLL